MTKSLYNVRNTKNTIFVKADNSVVMLLTKTEALDMIRALSSAMMDPFETTYTVKRDEAGRGEK